MNENKWMNSYIKQCADSQDPSLPRLQIIGNGDVFDNDVWRFDWISKI